MVSLSNFSLNQYAEDLYVRRPWLNASFCFGNIVKCSVEDAEEISDEEAFGATETLWTVTTAILVLQMQTGFALMESGSVSTKSETNIMVKNMLDMVFGGISYWAFGFAFSFGDDEYSNPFVGSGYYFLMVERERLGYIFALFFFQMSFATTSMTIVSGAMVERTKLHAYTTLSFFMTFVYAIPAHWMWGQNGFLRTLGVQDISGCGPVNLVGGVTGLVANLMLGPRLGAFESPRSPCPSPIKAITGLFFIWWGWIRFNSGSVYMVTKNDQWVYAVTSAVNTIIASIAGCATAVFGSVFMSKICKKPRRSPYDVNTIVNGVMGSLVSITSICSLCLPWEAFIIGSIGAAITIPVEVLLLKLKVDDPVSVIPVHVFCSVWGLLSVGLFLREEETTIPGQAGLFYTGQFYMLGVQLLAAVCIIVYTVIVSAFFLKLIDWTIGLRLSEAEEIIGADTVEHGTGGLFSYALTAADTTLSLTSIADHMLDTELKYKINNIMTVFFQSVAVSGLHLTIRPNEDGSLGFDIGSTEIEPMRKGGFHKEKINPRINPGKDSFLDVKGTPAVFAVDPKTCPVIFEDKPDNHDDISIGSNDSIHVPVTFYDTNDTPTTGGSTPTYKQNGILKASKSNGSLADDVFIFPEVPPASQTHTNVILSPSLASTASLTSMDTRRSPEIKPKKINSNRSLEKMNGTINFAETGGKSSQIKRIQTPRHTASLQNLSEIGNKSPATKRIMKLSANEISLNMYGTEITLTDSKGKSKKANIPSDIRPTQSSNNQAAKSTSPPANKPSSTPPANKPETSQSATKQLENKPETSQSAIIQTTKTPTTSQSANEPATSQTSNKRPKSQVAHKPTASSSVNSQPTSLQTVSLQVQTRL